LSWPYLIEIRHCVRRYTRHVPASPVILAIETSQREGSVALRDRAGRLHVESLRSSRHEDDLMRGIDALVKRAGLAPFDIKIVAVSIGPGGFTGLRVAVTTAKVLAFTVGARIVAVPSALVAAASTPAPASPALVVLASKSDSAWCTEVGKDSGGQWTIEGESGLRAAGEIDWERPASALIDRYAPAGFNDAARAHGVPVADPCFEAGICLCLGEMLFSNGQMTEPEALTPIYARPPQVTRREGSPASPVR
jgi:tRNA threonylcarbamoyl adenosine modification protein YeaZ